MYTTVGTCSCCGGPVQVPSAWGSILPPIPKCRVCGAVKKENKYGPVIQTTRNHSKPEIRTYTSNTTIPRGKL